MLVILGIQTIFTKNELKNVTPVSMPLSYGVWFRFCPQRIIEEVCRYSQWEH